MQVEVISPSGVKGTVPANMLKAFKDKGYKVNEVEIVSPAGIRGTVPSSMLKAFEDKGYSIASTSLSTDDMKTNVYRLNHEF